MAIEDSARSMKPFSDLTGKEKSIEVLRWICVPVAALVGAMAVPMVLRLLIPPPMAQLPGTPPTPGADVQRYVLPWIAPIVMSLPMVIAGAKTAPRWRLATAIVLAVLWALYAIQYYLVVHWVNGSGGHNAHFAVAIASGAAGVAYVYFSEKARGRPR